MYLRATTSKVVAGAGFCVREGTRRGHFRFSVTIDLRFTWELESGKAWTGLLRDDGKTGHRIQDWPTSRPTRHKLFLHFSDILSGLAVLTMLRVGRASSSAPCPYLVS